jgi:hypothetical protein
VTDRCRSANCQAEVFFVRSENGRPVILDAEPLLTGHLVVLLPDPKPGVQYGHDGRHAHAGVPLEPHDHGRGTQRVVVNPSRAHHHHDDRCEPPKKAVVVRAVYRDHHATCPDAGAWRGRTRVDPPRLTGVAALFDPSQPLEAIGPIGERDA